MLRGSSCGLKNQNGLAVEKGKMLSSKNLLLISTDTDLTQSSSRQNFLGVAKQLGYLKLACMSSPKIYKAAAHMLTGVLGNMV